MYFRRVLFFVSLVAFVSLFFISLGSKVQADDTFTVINYSDNGDNLNPISGSLRQFLTIACVRPGIQKIQFGNFPAGFLVPIQIQAPLTVANLVGQPCAASKIILEGTNIANREIFIDASSKEDIGGCSLDIKSNNVFVNNLSFGGNKKNPAICVASNAVASNITNNRIGVHFIQGGSLENASNFVGISIAGNKSIISNNVVSQNQAKGIRLLENGAENTINNNSIFGNIGLGIDLFRVNLPDGENGVTLHADGATTPNNSINLAEDVIITPLAGNNFSLSANSYAQNISNLTVEIYEVDVGDASDNLQKRDQRSYGEGKVLIQKFDNVKTSDTVQGSFVVPSFPGKLNTAYSALLTIPAKGTSEFSAVVKTGGDTNSKDPICEGEGGNGKGDGVQSPKAPTNIAAGRNSDKSVLLTFTDNSVDLAKADGFKIERAELGAAADCSSATGYNDVTATLTKNQSTPPNVSFTDGGAAANSKTLCYKVTAFRNIPDSGNHDLKTCVASSIVSLAPAAGDGNPPITNKPPVIVVNPNPTQPNDPIVIIITDNSVNETAFCIERADKSCQAAKDGDFKPNGEVVSPNPPATGGTAPYRDPTAEAGHNYCYRAKPKINGDCVASLTSNNADATKLNRDGSAVTPDSLVAEGSGGCSISSNASHFNFLSLIALLAIAPLVFIKAFRFKKVG